MILLEGNPHAPPGCVSEYTAPCSLILVDNRSPFTCALREARRCRYLVAAPSDRTSFDRASTARPTAKSTAEKSDDAFSDEDEDEDDDSDSDDDFVEVDAPMRSKTPRKAPSSSL